MVVFRCPDNNPISCVNFSGNFLNDFWNLLISWFVEEWDILNLNEFDFCLISKMLLHVLKQTTVSGTLEVSPNKCNKFCHKCSSLYLECSVSLETGSMVDVLVLGD